MRRGNAMKKKVFSILLTIVMLVSVIPFGAISAAAEIEVKHGILESSTGGQMIDERDVVYYYSVDSDTTCTATEAKVSGLSIAEGAEVHIVVAKGVTLTCIGGDASGFKGGGAGIEVPQYATLYLEGEGTVIAKGGTAGDGVVGEDGKSSDSNYYGGNGGNGGNGGKGDGGEVDKDHLNVTAGEKGADAQPINPVGTVRTSRTVKAAVQVHRSATAVRAAAAEPVAVAVLRSPSRRQQCNDSKLSRKRYAHKRTGRRSRIYGC